MPPPLTGTPHPNHFQQNSEKSISQMQLPQTHERHFPNHLQRQLNRVSSVGPPSVLQEQSKFQRTFTENGFKFLKSLRYDELCQRMSTLDSDMEKEIEELRQRYQAKHQPIIDAIDAKKKRQQNF